MCAAIITRSGLTPVPFFSAVIPPSAFHDVTTGDNGLYPAGPGYDLDTGRGTPVANRIVADLSGPFYVDQGVLMVHGEFLGSAPETMSTTNTAETINENNAFSGKWLCTICPQRTRLYERRSTVIKPRNATKVSPI